jgi:23S rRNA (guanosine2251-2'-O)-methyltransferase
MVFLSVAAGILIYEAVKQRGFTEDKTASAL